MSQREKFAVGVGGAGAALMLLLFLLVFPLQDERQALRQATARAREAIAEMHRLQAEYNAARERNRRFETQIREKPGGFSLFSYLDRLAGQAAIKDRITYMKPSTMSTKDSPIRVSRVEMKVEAARWEQLIDFFHRVETAGELVDIKRLSLTYGGNTDGGVDAIADIETFDLK